MSSSSTSRHSTTKGTSSSSSSNVSSSLSSSSTGTLPSSSASSSMIYPRKVIPSLRAGPLPSDSSMHRINDLALPHIESYNYLLDNGLQLAIGDIPIREFVLTNGDKLTLWIEEATFGYPMKNEGGGSGNFTTDPRLYPVECRERGLSYCAPLNITLCRRINDGEIIRLKTSVGDVPMMIRSSHCHLAGLGASNLVKAGEEAYEFGGYFICNGIERIIRMLQIPKRNYPMAITRSAYTNRGPMYSNKGVVIRCTRPDQTSTTLTLHYLTDGSATVRFTVRKQEFFLPVIMVLKALVPTSDREIYERVLAGDRSNTYLSDRIFMLLRDAKRYESALYTQDTALAYLGARFRTVLDIPQHYTDSQVGQTLLDRYVLVHIPKENGRDKFNLLILMLRKLYSFVSGAILEDNADSLANQELLLSGHLLLMFLKEKLYEFTQGIEESIKKEDSLYARSIAAKSKQNTKDAQPIPKILASAAPINVNDSTWFRKIVDRQPSVGKKAYYLLATGNLISSSGLDLMQVSGYTVVADKINFLRFTTHFRSVHRGQFFAEMKTTTVRKLLPENWGFLCPVHTPDGGPCGLLNHLAQPASVIAHPLSNDSFVRAATRAEENELHIRDSNETGKIIPNFITSITTLLVALGMTPYSSTGGILPANQLSIVLDGRVIGGASPHATYRIAKALRFAKACVASCNGVIDGVNGSGPNSTLSPEQLDTVAALRRAAVLGFTNVQDLPNRRKTMGKMIDTKEDENDTNNEENPDSLSNYPVGGGSLPGFGGIGVVPPSMEVAFLPPAWWDAEVDPHITDPIVGEERAARLSFIGTSTNTSVPLTNAHQEEKKGEGSSRLETDDDTTAPTKLVGLFPGLFLSTAPQRLVRPVLQLDSGLVELISPLEQPYMDIACTPEDVEEILHINLEQQQQLANTSSRGGKTDTMISPPPVLYTHIELSAVAMLSELACLTPFSDMNQSPRNMYQCQMAKQTMGTPLHSWNRRTDTKLFRLQTPQAPLVQNAHQRLYGFDEYPNGANACVAVIAYTGFDMEDACIINKSAFERGFGWASVYKTYEIDLLKDRPTTDAGRYIFHNQYVKGEQPVRGANLGAVNRTSTDTNVRIRPGDKVFEGLDEDGLPPLGTLLKEGDPMYAFLDTITSTHKVTRHKEIEPAYVDEIRIVAPSGTTAVAAHTGVQRVSIKLRFDRRPVVGDKFSSRHGQKGVLSYLWPQENMPFNDQGMTPDVIINPHAFPSRMTIGMLIEMMAGKAGALHGTFQDATPFRFNENQRAVDYFGEQLRTAGYNYHGTETFYSGITGEPLTCDIYYGVVYYQRLRHMVKDKAQVRSTGPINALTRQPVKGRKKGGGIRFGEMERDSLLAHGAAFLLHDRLMNSSDRHIALVCRKCGSLLAPHSVAANMTTFTDLTTPWSGNPSTNKPNSNDQLLISKSSSTDNNNYYSTIYSNMGGSSSNTNSSVTVNAFDSSTKKRRQPYCRACCTGEYIVPVPVPYVFRYLANELAAMNIKIQLELGEGPYGPAPQVL